jgi:hypothetical protein
LAIDSKPCGCDVVVVRIKDVAPNGYAIDRATVRQKKPMRPVKFELTDQARQAIDDYLKAGIRSPVTFCSRSVRFRLLHDNAAIDTRPTHSGIGNSARGRRLQDVD